MNPLIVELNVPGLPAPQGSHSAVMRGDRPIVIHGSSNVGRARLAAWRGAVTRSAREWMAANDFAVSPWEKDVALAIHVVFRFPTPKRTPKETLHARLPDLDKIARSTGDGIVDAGLVYDDSRFSIGHFAKRWVLGDAPGAEIYIYEATEDDLDDVIPCFAS
jgi:crossover junction endodeoxyribonuclease RusA